MQHYFKLCHCQDLNNASPVAEATDSARARFTQLRQTENYICSALESNIITHSPQLTHIPSHTQWGGETVSERISTAEGRVRALVDGGSVDIKRTLL